MLINHLLPFFFPVGNPLVNWRLIVLVLKPRVAAASTAGVDSSRSVLSPEGGAKSPPVETQSGPPGMFVSRANLASRLRKDGRHLEGE